ncbi:hypothetical protein [Amycolatopsis sp. Hca4]|uniref:hypothetical protein n=1 Tax=Amycolatopsis sp. Hca4 TaxID=2742131 RepID=UPI0015920C55|nr:hypothetical protein [Amycolatopsis sp. Hca4]QKV80102.1 hypothetical protein HUT10_44635 [Amycolatopsis sp. Hca4]
MNRARRPPRVGAEAPAPANHRAHRPPRTVRLGRAGHFGRPTPATDAALGLSVLARVAHARSAGAPAAAAEAAGFGRAFPAAAVRAAAATAPARSVRLGRAGHPRAHQARSPGSQATPAPALTPNSLPEL